MREIYPDDVTGSVLIGLENDGSDMTKPMCLDFGIDCDSEKDCKNFERLIDFSIEGFYYEYDEEEKVWVCNLEISMVPKYDSITAFEKKLTGLCNVIGAKYSGFGSFGNAVS